MLEPKININISVVNIISNYYNISVIIKLTDANPVFREIKNLRSDKEAK